MLLALLICAAAVAAVAVQGAWEQTAYAKGRVPAAGAELGGAVSVSGNLMAVGANQEGGCGRGVNPLPDHGCNASGAVFVYERNSSTGEWMPAVYLKASNAAAGEYFGTSVSLDGNRLAVGAYRENSCPGDPGNKSCSDSGAVYVFERQAGNWSETALLKGADLGTPDWLGWSVSLDGDQLVAGAIQDSSCWRGVYGDPGFDRSCSEAGAAYVFARNTTAGGNWTQEAYFKPGNTDANDQFGFSVSLDGDLLAVGAWQERSCGQGVGVNPADDACPDAGAAYVFHRATVLAPWRQEAYIKPANTFELNRFGVSLSLNAGVPPRLLVGAFGERSCATGVNGNATQGTQNRCVDSGAAYVFEYESSSWRQSAYLKASNTETNDAFGGYVALDGDRLAVAASSEGSCDPGVGGNQSDNACNKAGAVYVFEYGAGGWSQTAYLKAGVPGSGDEFGRSVSLDGPILAVGAWFEDGCGTDVGSNAADDDCGNAGAAYAFFDRPQFRPPPAPPGAATSSSTPSLTLSSPVPPTSGGTTSGSAVSEASPDGTSFPLIPIVVAAGALCCLLLLGAAIFLALRRRSAGTASSSSPGSGADEVEMAAAATQKQTAKEATEYQNLLRGVSIEGQIGEGNFGKVFRGTRKGEVVAVKQVQGGAAEDEFMKELEVMLGLDSPRVIELFGVCMLPDHGGGLGLVMEFAALGELRQHLKASGDKLSKRDLIQISLHIAEGLAYLHSVGIVHRDLAARNVLVVADGSCKLADFGLARTVGEGQTYMATSAIPVRWSAPELLRESAVSQASDCYSLAMTMVEVFDKGRAPFAELKTNLLVAEAVDDGERPARPKRCPKGVYALMESLWAEAPAERASASEAAKQLEAALADEADTTPDSPGTPVVYASVFLASRDPDYQGGPHNSEYRG